MSNYWFTSDLHLGHAAIINHCKRPFKHINEMDNHIINMWNKYVLKKDVVCVLGDFYWGVVRFDYIISWAKRILNGNIIFVKGNHDRWYSKHKRYMYNKKINKINVWGCHYPLATWPSGICLHGHSHGLLPEIPNRFDVGIDTNIEYRPYNFDEIISWIDVDYLNRNSRENIKYVQ